MTGFFKYFKNQESRPEHLRMVIDFSNGYHLGYDSMRKLGNISVAKDPESFADEKNLGMDALDKKLTFELFKKTALNNRTGVKSFLMRQDIFCGIGNIYSDEICFQAQLHPKKKINHLDENKLKTLFESMKTVLEKAIDCGADPEKLPDSYLIPHRTKKGKCPKCGGTVERIKVSGRSAYYCSECQYQ
jgi:formamidopyrimidine-DNA glycosylase